MLKLNLIMYGGRGQSIGISKRIPDVSNVTVSDNKIYNFYLNESQKHFLNFQQVGYTKEDGELLRKDMLEGLKNNEVHEYIREKTGYQKAVVFMKLGKTEKKQFKTIWGKKKEDKYYTNVSAYRYSEKRKK